MKTREQHLKGLLVNIMSDGLNRSMGALDDAGAIDRTKLMTEYCGIGSKYYDIVTEQLELTAEYCAQSVLDLMNDEADDLIELDSEES